MRCCTSVVSLLLASAAGVSAGPVVPRPYVDLTPIVTMPSLNLGTCCGSKPDVGLGPWLKFGGVGIDTAFGYGTQPNISIGLAGKARSDVFILSKIDPTPEMCKGGAAAAIEAVKVNNAQLKTNYTDIMLIHWPCNQKGDGKLETTLAQNQALWDGLIQAKQLGLVRSIGVSDFNVTHLAGLKGEKPVLHQHEMSIKSWDAATLEYSLDNDIWYEAWGVTRGCPFTDPAVLAIGKAHGVGAAQVCLRWTLQRGAIAAIGTGANAATIEQYTQEDLDVWDFELTDADMATLNAMGNKP